MPNYGRDLETTSPNHNIPTGEQWAWSLGINPYGDTIARTAYVYVGSLFSGRDIRIGVYSSTGTPSTHAPDTLLAQTPVINGISSAYQWYSADLTSPLSIDASTRYWFSLMMSSVSCNVPYSSIGGTEYVHRDITRAWGDGLIGTWSGGSNTLFRQTSGYLLVDAPPGSGGGGGIFGML